MRRHAHARRFRRARRARPRRQARLRERMARRLRRALSGLLFQLVEGSSTMNAIRRAVLTASVLAPLAASAPARAARMNPDVGPLVIEKRIVVAAPPAAVWRAWTDPAVITRYFAQKANIELRIGGA